MTRTNGYPHPIAAPDPLPPGAAAALAATLGLLVDLFGDRAKVTLVVRKGGMHEKADDYIVTDDELADVIEAIRHTQRNRNL